MTDADNIPAVPNEVNSDSDDSVVEILDAGSDTEIYEETELIKFSRMLSDAQKRAQAEEKAKGKKRKTYDGSSRATAYRRKQRRRALVAWGQLSVPDFMKWRETKKTKEELTASIEESEESSDNDTASVSCLGSWRNEPSESEGTEVEEVAPAASADRCQTAPGPVATEMRRRVVQNLAEEEEDGSGSEDEDGASKTNAHLGATLFEDLRRHVLTESVESNRLLSDRTPALPFGRSELRAASAELAAKANAKELDLVTRRRIQGMLGHLNLYLDDGLSLGWKKASVFVSKTQGHGETHARRIREWNMNFLQSRALPLHRLGQARSAVLRDEDIASEIQKRIIERSKNGFVKAEDVVDLVASPEIQRVFSEKGICKSSISKKTATRWLQKLDWRYQGTRNGMYIDGHEREDVVAYRREFVERWGTYERRFHQWDNDGHELPRPNGFPVPDGLPFRLVLITHDESTFYQNDRRKTAWAQKTSRPVPQPKGDGQSIMISDFLTSEWGPLRDGSEFVHRRFSSL
jgi:hypothetical protein